MTFLCLNVKQDMSRIRINKSLQRNRVKRVSLSSRACLYKDLCRLTLIKALLHALSVKSVSAVKSLNIFFSVTPIRSPWELQSVERRGKAEAGIARASVLSSGSQT